MVVDPGRAQGLGDQGGAVLAHAELVLGGGGDGRGLAGLGLDADELLGGCGGGNRSRGPRRARAASGPRALTPTSATSASGSDPQVMPPPAPTLLRLVSVTDRRHQGDRFVRDWATFDPVAAGQRIAVRADGGELRAERDGFIVFPNAVAGVGTEWFYFAVASERDLGPRSDGA